MTTIAQRLRFNRPRFKPLSLYKRRARVTPGPALETVIVTDAIRTWVAKADPTELVEYAHEARYIWRDWMSEIAGAVMWGIGPFLAGYVLFYFFVGPVLAMVIGLGMSLPFGGLGWWQAYKHSRVARWHFWREAVYEQVPIRDADGAYVVNDDGEQVYEPGAFLHFDLIPVTPEAIIRDSEAMRGYRADIVEAESEQESLKSLFSRSAKRTKRLQQMSIAALVGMALFGSIIVWAVTDTPDAPPPPTVTQGRQ